jgi:RNA polymerase sigma factor (sigma-70 family)
MADANDMQLLQDYYRQGLEEAFAALVERHINLVYSVALRQVGNAAHAEEITQAVFVILARKAARLRPGIVLEAWLHETTRLTALSFLRGERRRQFREQEAYMQSVLQESADISAWKQLAPLLDEALSRLGEKDRAAVVLRFFKDKSLRDIAAALRISEAAAQRRVLRAVEKLRLFFTKRGVVLPAAVLTASISTHSVHAAPAALAGSVTAAAMAKGAAASGSTLILIKEALKLMAWTKAKTAVIAGVILAAASTTGVVGYNLVQAHETKPPLQSTVFDLRADGNALVQSTIEAVNTSKETWGTNDMAGPMYSAMDIERFTDGQGQAVKHTKQPGEKGNPFKYTFALNQPVSPGGKLVMKMEGTIDGPGTGLIQPTAEPDVLEYHLNQRTGSEATTHFSNVYRLPPGAVLLEKSPADLAATTNGGRVELRLDKLLPPPGQFDVRFRYRLAAATK